MQRLRARSSALALIGASVLLAALVLGAEPNADAERFIVPALGDDAEARAWLVQGHDAGRSTEPLDSGDWSLDWRAHWDDPDADLRPAIQLVMNHSPRARRPDGAAPSGDWSPDGTSTYAGTWTSSSLDFPDPVTIEEGSLEIDCSVRSTSCTLDGDPPSLSGDAPVVADGVLHREERANITQCGEPAEQTIFLDVEFDAEGVRAVEQWITVPWTCELYSGELYSTDVTYMFEGTLVDFVPRDVGNGAEDLAGYLTGYGLGCAPVASGLACRLESADARYEATTTRDDDGEVVAIAASVTSFDTSMPSDAGAFLRGVAERSPVEDQVALTAWFDEAITGGAPEFVSGPWSAAWTDTDAAAGIAWTLEITRGSRLESLAPVATEEPALAPPAEQPGGPIQPETPAFARSVPKPAEVSTDPVILLQSAALAALLVFLMPLPSQLFNSTLETHEDEVRRWLRLDRIGAVVGSIGAFWASWPGVALFTLLAAVLYGFLDPGFGLSLGSLATFLGMLLGIVLVTAAFAVPAVLAHRRHGDRPSFKVVPVSLLIGVACVLLSRLTDFQPGYLYGLLIGLAFARELSAAEEGRATAIGALVMLAVALVSWLGLGALPEGDAFGLVVARTSLAALMVAGLEGVVFGLLPMRFLPGEPLYAWNRVLWGALLLVGAFAFFHILINPASGYLSDTSRTPLFTVLALLLGFSLVSVAFWAWFRFRPPGPHPVPDHRGDA